MKHNFRQLTIWKDAVTLAKEIYTLTQQLPKEHKYGISSQMFRAAVSISSNIAEGSSKNSQKEFAYYLRSSLGSAFELETQLIITQQCDMGNEINIDFLITKAQTIQRQIASFANTIEKAKE